MAAPNGSIHEPVSCRDVRWHHAAADSSVLVGGTLFAGPFKPPFWAHVYTGALGLALLLR